MFVEAPQDVQQVERIARDVAAPKMINMISASVTPLLTFAQLETYGFSLAIYPMVTMASAMDGMMRALRALREDQDDRSVAHLQNPRELFELFDLAGWRGIAERDI